MTPEAAQKDYAKAVARQSQRPHIAFTVLGPPVGKERARVSSGHLRDAIKDMINALQARNVAAAAMAVQIGRRALLRGIRSYTPKKTAEYEKHVRSCAHAAVLQWQVEKPKRMNIDMWPAVKSVYCDTWIYMGRGPWPDAGNVSKAIVDACSGILWVSANKKADDNKVLERQQARVEHSPRPRVDVLVSFAEQV